MRKKGMRVPTHQFASVVLNRHACQRYGQPGKSYHYVPISCLITQFFRKCTGKWRRFQWATDRLDLRGLDKRNSSLQVTLCERGTRSRYWTVGSEERIKQCSKILSYACCMHPALIMASSPRLADRVLLRCRRQPRLRVLDDDLHMPQSSHAPTFCQMINAIGATKAMK